MVDHTYDVDDKIVWEDRTDNVERVSDVRALEEIEGEPAYKINYGNLTIKELIVIGKVV